MKRIRFISRADDLGSSHSANAAIEKVVNAGFIKNVSIMACGPAVEAAAERLAHRKDICFGMHTTLNAEWDRVKWGPVLSLDEHSGLTDSSGDFLSHPSMFVQTKPDVDVIMREVSAQLERLHKLGFPVRYIDSHMFPELYVDGLDEAIAEFAAKKGLLDHMYYYRLPPWGLSLHNPMDTTQLPDGQYFSVSHPSLDTEEMRMTGNSRTSGAVVAASRAKETVLLSDPKICGALQEAGVQSIRYDEADYGRRLTPAELMQRRSVSSNKKCQ